MKDFELVEVFKYRRRICAIVRVNFMSRATGENPSHNGYVSTRKSNDGKGYMNYLRKISTDELTYAGELEAYEEIPSGWYFGFDSLHYWNDQHPESKTFQSVKQRTKKLADEMIKKGI